MAYCRGLIAAAAAPASLPPRLVALPGPMWWHRTVIGGETEEQLFGKLMCAPVCSLLIFVREVWYLVQIVNYFRFSRCLLHIRILFHYFPC